MSRQKTPHPHPYKLVVIRVDSEYPRTWFKGYSEFGEALTTTDYTEAARMDWDDASRAIYCLKADYMGTIWSMRAVQEADGPQP